MIRRDLLSRGSLVVLALLMFLLPPACAQAAQYSIDGRQAQTDYVPGMFVDLATPGGVDYQAQTTDIFGDPVSYYSYAAVCDTGASGNVISAFEAQARALPTTGETYSDVGIGGAEWFNVSQPTQVKLAPVTVGYAGSENLANFPSYGNYKLQVRQQDPVLTDTFLGDDPVYVNVVGTPVLNQRVMHAMPNAPSFTYSFDALGMSPVEYVPTELLASAPGSLAAANSQLVLVPAAGGAALHVPLSYQNFITGSAAPTTSTNPTIPGVQVIDSRKPANQQSAPSSWLFDSGAAVTMVGRDLATAIGINLNTETPVTTTTVMGIGGDLRTINGYQVQKLVVPLTGGDQLVFDNIVVFVPGAGDLPADLPGILGMNLLNKSFSGVDEMGSYQNLTTSAFSDWYVVPVKGAYWTGTGNWDAGTTTWATTSGGTYNQGWTAAADAIFEGTAGTVTVASAGVASVNSMTFNTDGYTLTGTGAITLTGNGSITTGGGTDTINCPLAGSAGLTKNGAGTLILSGQNSYTGNTTINAGTLQLGNGGTTGSISGNVYNSGLLAFNRSDTLTFAGNISGCGGLTQQGTGRVILTGVSSYSGVTTVASGALQINNASATANVLTNVDATAHTGGTNVSGGFLVLDYGANLGNQSSLVSRVQSLLQTAYNGGSNSFQAGHDYQLYSTAASASIGLGWVDNAATHQVTVMPALYGDANLDGVVNFADFNKVLTNYNMTGMSWSQGDFNYDGVVNFADLNKVLTNYNLTGPLNINNLPMLAYDALEADSQAMQLLGSHGISISEAVPEPSSIALLLTLLASLAAWRIARR